MGYTRISELIWSWEPFTSLSSDARILWLALFTGPTARRLLPGLWQGTPQQMADEARVGAIETINALDRLLDKELVEYDPKTRVIRLTELPDAGEWPTSHTIIRSWWRRFQTVPQCAVRDAHVTTLRWLLERGAALSEENRSGKPSAKHEEIWGTTFGTIVIPPVRRRGLRHASADTGTAVQPSLFDFHSAKPERITLTRNFNTLGWHPGAPGEGEGEGEGDLSSSGSGTRHPEPSPGRSRSDTSIARATSQLPEQIPPPTRTKLELVPLPDDLPFSVSDLLAAVASQSAGRFSPGPIDERVVDAILATIRACGQAEVGLEDLRLVGRWLASGGLSYRTDLGPVWASRPGNLLDAVGQARAWRDRGEPKLASASGRGLPPADPAPNSAFRSGRQVL